MRNELIAISVSGRTEHVAVPGNSGASDVATAFGLGREHYPVMPNAVPGLVGPFGPPQGHSINHIVFLGRLVGGKGVSDAIAAFGTPAVANIWRPATAAREPIRCEQSNPGLQRRVDSRAGLTARSITYRHRSSAEPSQQGNLAAAVVEALAHRVAVTAPPVGARSEFPSDDVSVDFPLGRDAPALAAPKAELFGDAPLSEMIRWAALRSSQHLARFPRKTPAAADLAGDGPRGTLRSAVVE
jgi:hypothetical protein